MAKKLTVHTIVKNEERWIWYALMSVKDYVDQIFVYDTGSSDKTVEIINTIKDIKIIFEEKGPVDRKGLVKLREEQLKRTKTNWFLILDGDEIWPKKAILELKGEIDESSDSVAGIVVRAWNLIGDIYHYHPESETYHWPFAPKNFFGWANLRALKNTPGLKISGNYPLEAYLDQKGTPIQNYGEKGLAFLKERYFHASYLPRSNFINNLKTLNRKFKFELGKKFPPNFSFPEALYLKRPSIVPSPWENRSFWELFLSSFFTPAKALKRKL